MEIQHFSSGSFREEFQYRTFQPSWVNHAWTLNDAELGTLLSQADRKLGELNAFSQLVPDVDFFIRMHVNKEATTSSRIEGTQTNIEDVLQKIENIDPEKRSDWEEVRNYIHAMNQAIGSLGTLPLSGRLLRETHRILMQGVRGEKKLPGEYRSSQNWIGGASLKDTVFIPPHQRDVPELMSDLERFLNEHDHPVPDLIKIGIAHYQFETIHPFLDGNGRIGRLMIPLYLVERGLLVKPSLYLSAFFEQHKTLYYDNLMRVRTHGDLRQWLRFFLEGIRQTAENAIQTFRSIIALREECERKILTLGKKTPLARNALHLLFRTPIVDGQDFVAAFSINLSTALRLIEDLIRLEILQETTGFKRNRIFAFQRYIALFEREMVP
ncbi:MAG: Fic family protein [Fibrobacterota bacterium]|nr:Fic family protein [Fibrobacterota bacterium]